MLIICPLTLFIRSFVFSLKYQKHRIKITERQVQPALAMNVGDDVEIRSPFFKIFRLCDNRIDGLKYFG